MTSPRIKVTAGLHEVGFTFIERPTQEQNVWQPVLRDSQEAHNPSGMPRLRNGNHRRPVQRHRRQPQRDRVRRLFVCTPTTAAQEAPCADKILSAVARRAFRRPVVDDRHRRAAGASISDERKAGGDFDAGIRAGLARILDQSRRSCSDRSRIRPASPAARRIASANSSWRAACRSSSGAASRMTSC